MPGVHGRLECDSHADTTCAGKNCVVLSYTNHVIDVYGFHESLGTMPSVPIATVATVAIDSKGNEVVLVIHEALFFGDMMNHSLLCVNQAWSYGVPVWDNPCDPYHKLGIEADGTNVEMQADGIVIFVDTRSPTLEELKTLPQIELTSSARWEPHRATYQLHPLGVEYLDEARVSEVRCASSTVVPSVIGVTCPAEDVNNTQPVSGFVDLSPLDWAPPQFDSAFVPSSFYSFGVSDLVIGSVSTVYTPSFLEAVVPLDTAACDFAPRLRMGFSTISDSRCLLYTSPSPRDS